MKFLILFLVLVLFSTLSISGHSLKKEHASETKSINKLLDKMLSTHEGELSSINKRQERLAKITKRLQEELAKKRKAFAASKKKEADLEKVETVEEATLNREKELVARIKAMLAHERGASKEHPARSCGGIMRHGGKPSGMYWVLRDGHPKEVYCVARGKHSTSLGRLVYSGGCSKGSTGSNWRNLCIDDSEHEFRTSQDSDFVVRKGADNLLIKKTGMYRVMVNVNMYAPATKQHNLQVFAGGKEMSHIWSNNVHTDLQADGIRFLKKGDTIQVRGYTSHGSGQRWVSKQGSNGYNRVQVSFLGPKSENPMYSGYCGPHANKDGWATFCLDKQLFDTSPRSNFVKGGFLSLVAGNKAHFLVHRAGSYRFNLHHLTHSNGFNDKHMEYKVTGTGKLDQGFYRHSKSRYWASHSLDQTLILKKGDKVDVRLYGQGSNPYRWHGGGAHGQHNHLQIQFLADPEKPVKSMRLGPRGHERSTNAWRTFKLDYSSSKAKNTLTKDISTASSGLMTVKRDGMFRFSVSLMQHSNSDSHRYARLRVNGKKTLASTRCYGRGWMVNTFDVTIPLRKGDKADRKSVV